MSPLFNTKESMKREWNFLTILGILLGSVLIVGKINSFRSEEKAQGMSKKKSTKVVCNQQLKGITVQAGSSPKGKTCTEIKRWSIICNQY